MLAGQPHRRGRAAGTESRCPAPVCADGGKMGQARHATPALGNTSVQISTKLVKMSVSSSAAAVPNAPLLAARREPWRLSAKQPGIPAERTRVINLQSVRQQQRRRGCVAQHSRCVALWVKFGEGGHRGWAAGVQLAPDLLTCRHSSCCSAWLQAPGLSAPQELGLAC